ncbi:MAG: hypothetical protein ACM3L9_00360 [Deltaproteobacteria bacterium]
MGAKTDRRKMGRSAVAITAASCIWALGGAASAQDARQAPLASSPETPAAAGTGNCTKTDFETVVDQSAAALRDLNLQNRPRFQEKLRALRDKKRWSQDQFLKEAVPYVKDEQIDAFDRKTSELLTKITSMGDEGSASATPDCSLYQGLRANMSELVDTQNAKWTYMFRKIDAALGE